MSDTFSTYGYLLPKWNSRLRYSYQVLLCNYFSTPNRYPISYSYQLLLSIYYTVGQRIHVGMDEMYETAQKAKHKFCGIDEMQKICAGWNARN